MLADATTGPHDFFILVATTIPVLLVAAMLPVSQNLVGKSAPKDKTVRLVTGVAWLLVIAVLAVGEASALVHVWQNKATSTDSATWSIIGLVAASLLVVGAFYLPGDDSEG